MSTLADIKVILCFFFIFLGLNIYVFHIFLHIANEDVHL